MHSNPVIPLAIIGDIKNLIPLRDRVLIMKEPMKGTTAGGIVLPTVDKSNAACVGIVIAKGDGLITGEGNVIKIPDIEVGDKVLYPPMGGQNITDGAHTNGPEYCILREGQIIAVIKQ
jgi:co-chaperonin GroES (HSP10)